MRIRERVAIVVVASVIAVLGLSGCGTPVAPPPGTGTPSPTVEPEPVAVPGSRVPIPCEELLPADVVADLTGVSIAQESRTPTVEEAALAGAGLARCSWSSPDSIQTTVTVFVSADADDVRENSERETAPPFVADSITSSSALYCEGTDIVACSFTFGTDQYAVDGWISYPIAADSLDGATSAVTDVLTGLAARLDATTPLPEWTPPVRATAEFLDCTPLAAGDAVTTALGWTDAWGPSFDGSGDWAWLAHAAYVRSGFNECTWGTPQGSSRLLLTYAPGASWAWEDGAPVEGESLEVAGALSAVARCDEYNCSVEALVDESWVVAQIARSDGSGVAEAVAALEAAIPLLPIVAGG